MHSRLSIPFKLLSISDTQKKLIKKERRKDIGKDRERGPKEIGKKKRNEKEMEMKKK
jgi:hypothetical protein